MEPEKEQLYFLRFQIARMQNKHSRPFSKEWHESLYAIQRFMRAYQWQTFSEWMRRSDRLLNRQKSQQSCKTQTPDVTCASTQPAIIPLQKIRVAMPPSAPDGEKKAQAIGVVPAERLHLVPAKPMRRIRVKAVAR